MKRGSEGKKCEGDTTMEKTLRSMGMQTSLCRRRKSEGPEQGNTE